MLVASTEPAPFLALGERSSVCEEYGADFLFVGAHGLVGVQRKEVKDFINSSRNGTLARELAKMGALHHGVLLVEGNWMWTGSGVSMLDTSISKEYIRGIMWSVQEAGIWLVESDGIADSVGVLKGLETWAGKQHHRMVLRRNPGPRWADGSREWGIHFLQGIDGLGVERSAAIWDQFSGVPMVWAVTEKELMNVPGIGKGLAKKLLHVLPANQEIA